MCKRIYGYITKFKHFNIKFRVEEPDFSEFDNRVKSHWSISVYENASENFPEDSPEPRGKQVTLIHYFDANLMHNRLFPVPGAAKTSLARTSF